MVAEVGNMGMETVPTESEKEKFVAKKLQAKRAAILARKRSTSSSKTTTAQNLKLKENREELEALDAEAVVKKRKKFVPAPWLCGGMTIESVARIRSDVDEALAVVSGTTKPGIYEENDEGDSDFDFELALLYHKRRKAKSDVLARRKEIASLNHVTKQKIYDVVRSNGKKTIVRNDLMSRLRAQNERLNHAKELRNANTELVLERLGMRRKRALEALLQQNVRKEDEKPSSNAKPKPNYVRSKKSDKRLRPGKTRKPRWTEEQRETRMHIPHEFELCVGNIDCDDPEETDLLCFLMDMQQREMTPEDYEMLLRLDEKVAPKTVDTDRLASLRTETISDAESETGPDGIPWVDTLCAVCMESYENGQTVKFLPCEHVFHAPCIEMWLNNSGNTCPLDGLEL